MAERKDIDNGIFDAKGDLLVGTGSDAFAVQAVGTNGKVLTADSTKSTGVDWVTAPTPTGAVAKADYDANTVLAANVDDTPLALTMGASTILARLAAGNIKAATPAEIVTLLGLALPDYTAGLYYPCSPGFIPGAGGLGNQAVAQAIYTQFVVTKSHTFDRIGIVSTVVSTAGGLYRLGVLADNGNGKPGTLLLDAGTIATDVGIGLKEITISLLLAPGMYWAVSVAQVAACQVKRSGSNVGLGPVSSDLTAGVFVLAGVTGALASNPAVTLANLAPTSVILRA